ncbi:hypothetical protein CYLTODRAFT_486784 [Cylindrobasidium torrendii FP15055 ss-10]|uniref:Histone H1 n=1 Tax=Cylindrobasidium torrendii FP15055 ss-10 TaxID=1314674 RepID=A0A0D7BQX4_9AGAR|nr:hypothetical protein CYLTODRAFT_486784 [Cylindrobasidium torrendii FP15055 ss-10]
MQANAATNPIFATSIRQVQSHLSDGKRQYLEKLPLAQIVEICLLFEVHVPQYVRLWVWPEDILNGYIPPPRTSQPPSLPTPAPAVAAAAPAQNGLPIMSALVAPQGGNAQPDVSSVPAPEPSPSSNPPPVASSSASKPSTPAAPVVQPLPEASTPAPAPVASPVPVATPAVAPTPAPAPVPAVPQAMAGYPHQPYGYSSYAAYYPHLWPHPYAQMPYAVPAPPSTSNTTTYQAAAYQAAQPAPAYAPPPPPPVQADPIPSQPSRDTDEMPSYEDMIVEALSDTRELDGIAPKDVYTWMAANYPVQANFRPSASQALQKAYRKGRFVKSSSGKYKLNPAFTGVGHNVRKPTRRPHTINNASSSSSHAQGSLPSPFTKAPLTRAPKPAFAGMGSFQHTFGVTSPTPAAPEADDAEAYEAAQHILRTITSGDGFFTLGAEPEPPANSNDQQWEEGVRAQLQSQLSILAGQLQEYAQEHEREQLALRAPPAATGSLPHTVQPSALFSSPQAAPTQPTVPFSLPTPTPMPSTQTPTQPTSFPAPIFAAPPSAPSTTPAPIFAAPPAAPIPATPVPAAPAPAPAPAPQTSPPVPATSAGAPPPEPERIYPGLPPLDDDDDEDDEDMDEVFIP